MKNILISSLVCLYVFGSEPMYQFSDIHGFLPQGGSLTIKAGIEAVNDTIDVFKIKQSEFNANTSGFDTLGDMKGVDFQLGYGMKYLYLHTTLNQKNLQYSGTTLTNNYFDIYGRYEVFQLDRSAFALDVGYETNKAKNTYLRDETAINDTIKRAFPEQTITINNRVLTQIKDGVTSVTNLAIDPYVALLDTKDEAFYWRGVASFWSKYTVTDFFGGYKQIKIENNIDSSIAHEVDLEDDLANGDLKASYSAKREDGMIFAGMNFGVEYKQISAEFKYQYNKMIRIDCLKEMEKNHIVDLNFLYNFTPNLGAYLGGHIMSNQFNGEIPYLYTKYTKTTFDHKYGYARTGIVYRY